MKAQEIRAWQVIECLTDEVPLTVHQIRDRTGQTREQVNLSLRYARHEILPVILDHGALVCRRAGRIAYYSLALSHDDVLLGSTSSKGDLKTRIRSLYLTAHIDVSRTDGRTLDGREARIIEKHLQRLMEDLQELTI